MSRRTLLVSNHQDTDTITCPAGGILNMAVATPSAFTLINNLVGSPGHGLFTVGTLTGIVAHFDNVAGGSRQLCLKPFFHSWPRFIAVLGAISGTEVLHFRSWMGGVVFGAGTAKSRGARVNPDRTNKYHAPILGANLAAADKSL